MKLPKFMKSHKSEAKKGSEGGSRQLLITELNFQPHKNAAAIMNFDKSLYMTPRGLNSAMMMTPKLGADNKPINNYGGRYVKSAQPKRLQQNKPKVYAGGGLSALPLKPTSTTTTTKNTTYTISKTNLTGFGFETTPVLKKLDNRTSSQSALTGRKLEEPVASGKQEVTSSSSKSVDTVDSKTMIKSETSTTLMENNKENYLTTTPSKLDTALVETPHPTSRFSFSKLTRFVSKSALKVMSRKLSSSPMSLDSSDASSSSSSSISSPPTPSIIEPPGTRRKVEDEAVVKNDDEKNKLAVPSLPPPPIPRPSPQQQSSSSSQPVYTELDSATTAPVQQQQQQAQQTTCSIYKSDEQRAEIEKRVARMIEEHRTCTSIRPDWCSSSRLVTSTHRVPNMGITSVMLRELKKKQQQQTTGTNLSGTIGIVPLACLVSAPHIFSSSSIPPPPPPTQPVVEQKEEEKNNDRNNNKEEEEEETTLQQSPPQYDRLSRVPFLGDDVVTPHSATKKASLSRPMVKSLSSIAPLVMPPPSNTNTSNNKTTTTPPSSCRISIFSAKKQLINICQSTGHLAQQQQPFESFSETVF